MPIPLPPKARAKAVQQCQRETVAAIDWLGLWALSVGFCAIVLAGIADLMGGDKTGAACILIGAAGIMALVFYAGAEADRQS